LVPITFACSCGKTLRVKDGLAGRWVRCPACKETAIVPEAAMTPKPAFEVVEDEPAPPPRKSVPAEVAPLRRDDHGPPRIVVSPGVMAALGMILGGGLWLAVGLMNNRFYVYSPILIFLGIINLIRCLSGHED
jgi:hypothetical protein